MSRSALLAAMAQDQAVPVMLTERMKQQLVDYYEAVIEMNQVMNLTRIVEPVDFWRKHYVDSYLADSLMVVQAGNRCLDLGTGGGFPGVPMAILHPDTEWVLVDSVAKKLRFVEQAACDIGLTNIKTVHGRAEDLARDKAYRDNFDVVVSRAVADLTVLVEWALPFVRVGGRLVALKGADGMAELAAADYAISTLGGIVETSSFLTVPETEEKRVLVAIQKVAATPSKYPRKAGTASRQPLRKGR